MEANLKEICLGIEARDELIFIEIGLRKSMCTCWCRGYPPMAVHEIVRINKSLTAQEVFKWYPKIEKDILWED